VTDPTETTDSGSVFKGPPLEDVLLEHLEELAFLAIQRRKLLFAHDLPLRDFEPHDQRIAAHWDALVIGGEASAELARARLSEPDPWDVFAAAWTWVELGAPKPDEIFDAIDGSEGEALLGWRAALQACDPTSLGGLAEPALASSSAPVQAAFTYGLGWQGLLPLEATPSLLASQDVSVRRNLARAAGLGGIDEATSRRLSASLVTDSEPEVRAAAIWSVALMNPQGATQWCRERASKGDLEPVHARILGLFGESRDRVALRSFAEGEHEARTAGVFALGDLGDEEVLPLLREWLDNPESGLSEAAHGALDCIFDDTPPGSSDAEGESAESLGEEEAREAEEEWWKEAADRSSSEGRMLRGYGFPWGGPAAEQPMGFLWRSVLGDPTAEPRWLRREVPDGWFSGRPSDEAIPGE
jgi:hypothetical protein